MRHIANGPLEICRGRRNFHPVGSGDITCDFPFFFLCPAISVNNCKNGHQESTEMDELKAEVAQIESSKTALDWFTPLFIEQ